MSAIRCPVHNMPDCSPLLNGCSLVIHLHQRVVYQDALEKILEAPLRNNIVAVRAIAREALRGF